MGMNKDIILVISSEQGGGGGCFAVRLAAISNYLNAAPKYGVKVVNSPMPIFDGDLLARTRCVLIQRPVAPMPWIKRYAELAPKYLYKIVADIDDLWTEWNGISLPPYHPNAWQQRDCTQIDNLVKEHLRYIDAMIVSTEELKHVLNDKYNYFNVEVIENAIPRSFYNGPRKDFFRSKPVCIIPSGRQHLREPIQFCSQFPAGVTGMRGDYTGEWVPWLKQSLSSDKLELIEMAGPAYFWQDMLDKIQQTPWMDYGNYAGYLNRTRPDIILAPLDDNPFVWCKSWLKFAEACALGAVLMGSYFDKSPYRMMHPLCRVPHNPTKEQLDKVFTDIKANWKEILEYQYDFINRHGDFIESTSHMNKFLSICNIPNQNLI